MPLPAPTTAHPPPYPTPHLPRTPYRYTCRTPRARATPPPAAARARATPAGTRTRLRAARLPHLPCPHPPMPPPPVCDSPPSHSTSAWMGGCLCRPRDIPSYHWCVVKPRDICRRGCWPHNDDFSTAPLRASAVVGGRRQARFKTCRWTKRYERTLMPPLTSLISIDVAIRRGRWTVIVVNDWCW